MQAGSPSTSIPLAFINVIHLILVCHLVSSDLEWLVVTWVGYRSIQLLWAASATDQKTVAAKVRDKSWELKMSSCRWNETCRLKCLQSAPQNDSIRIEWLATATAASKLQFPRDREHSLINSWIKFIIHLNSQRILFLLSPSQAVPGAGLSLRTDYRDRSLLLDVAMHMHWDQLQLLYKSKVIPATTEINQ